MLAIEAVWLCLIGENASDLRINRYNPTDSWEGGENLATDLDGQICRLIGAKRWHHQQVQAHLADLGDTTNLAPILPAPAG